MVEAGELEHIVGGCGLDARVAGGLAARCAAERAADAVLDARSFGSRRPPWRRTAPTRLISLICWLSAESPVVIVSASRAWRPTARERSGLKSKRLTWRTT